MEIYQILSYAISSSAVVLLIVSVIFFRIANIKKQNKKKIKWGIIAFLTIAIWSISVVVLWHFMQQETDEESNNSEQSDHIGDNETSYAVVSFDTNGGSVILEQKIKKGDTISILEYPEKDGFVFVGWYTDTDFSELFDINETVSESCTLFARWVNITDITDTDNDGLPDEIEKYYGTNVFSDDTDGDGLNDYIEVAVLGYDPLSIDTDNDGIQDAEEDLDGDGINNKQEVELGTNPTLVDTDGDGLIDHEEINIYKTDPVIEDTDKDGANDSWEIEHSFDPLTFNEIFNIEIKSKETLEYNDVITSARISESGKQVSTIKIESAGKNEQYLLSQSIPGYLGSVYDFQIDGNITSATITFKYNTSLGTISDSFQPRIYYFNEAEGTLEELENQTICDGEVSVIVSHFSKYILLNKVDYDRVWNTEIESPDSQNSSVDLTVDSNNDGIPDYYNDLILSGDLVVGNGSREFYGINFNYDADGNISNDYDGDGLRNGEELEIVKNGGKIYIVIKSNPVMKDTDGDGKIDLDDPDPLKWNISDRDLAMCCSMAYASIPSEIHSVTYLDDLPNSLKGEINNNFNEFGNAANMAELKRWKIIDTKSKSNGMQAVAFKIDSNIVVAYRGTNGFLDGLTDISEWIVGVNMQSASAKQFLVQVMKKNPNCDIYVTGHSLGGNLTYHAASDGIEYNAPAIRGIVTFNGLGLALRHNFVDFLWADKRLKDNSSIIRDYRVYGDWVSEGIIGNVTEHYGGKPIYYNKSPSIPKDITEIKIDGIIFGIVGKKYSISVDWNCHNLYTFLEVLGRESKQEVISIPVKSGAVLDVMDAKMQKYRNYHLTITKILQTRDLLENISELEPDVVVDTDINNANGYILDLDEGTYLISVKDNNGNVREYKKTIKIIGPSIRDEYYVLKNVVIYTNFGNLTYYDDLLKSEYMDIYEFNVNLLSQKPYSDHINFFTASEYELNGYVYHGENGWGIKTLLPNEISIIKEVNEDFDHDGSKNKLVIESSYSNFAQEKNFWMNFYDIGGYSSFSLGLNAASLYSDRENFYYLINRSNTDYMICESEEYTSVKIKNNNYYFRSDTEEDYEKTEKIEIINLSDLTKHTFTLCIDYVHNAYYYKEEIDYKDIQRKDITKVLFAEKGTYSGYYEGIFNSESDAIKYISDALSLYNLSDRIISKTVSYTGVTPLFATKVVGIPQIVNLDTINEEMLHGTLWIGN